MLLDGLRGVAAICVVLFHLSRAHFVSWLPNNGFLAVDFFFVLSGFVLMHAYGDRLRDKPDAWRFFLARAIRFYPLYLLGAAIGLVVIVIPWMVDGTSRRFDSVGQFVSYALAAVVMLPTWWHVSSPFPLNGPSWSLFFELAVNLSFAFTLQARISRNFLIAYVALLACICVTNSIRLQTMDVGWNLDTFAEGIPRVLFSFYAGVACHMLYQSRHWTIIRSAWLPPLIAALLVASLFYWGGSGRNILVASLTTFLLFPMLILASARITPVDWMVPTFRFLGAASFPLYAIHEPLVSAAWAALSKTLTVSLTHVVFALLCMIFVIASTSLAWVVGHYYDLPARRWLTHVPPRRWIFKARPSRGGGKPPGSDCP